MKIVCISDTHGCMPPTPPGDLLIHAGDLTMKGTPRQLEAAIEWLKAQPQKHKIVIAGNHDFCLQEGRWARFHFGPSITYLQDSMAEVEGLRIWGSPWTLRFYDWAFMKNEMALAELYAAVPPCDILITHGPPFGILDEVPRGGGVFRENVGATATLELVHRIKPKLHVFGHIHEGHGIIKYDDLPTTFVNASYCTGIVAAVGAHDPIEVEL